MIKMLSILYLLFLPTVATTQKMPSYPEDRILDKLVGEWTASGLAHGNAYTWTMHGEWVLSHQFLRLTEKSSQNIVNEGRPFEAIYFVRYDYQEHRYSAHIMKNFDAENSQVLGYSESRTDQLALVYKLPEETVTEQFTWKPESKEWQVKSWAIAPNGERSDLWT